MSRPLPLPPALFYSRRDSRPSGHLRGPFAPPIQFFPPAEDQALAEFKAPAVLRQRPAIHQLGAGFGQRAFAKDWEFFVENARQNQLQDGVPQKLEALIVLSIVAVLVGDGRVGERQTQELPISKRVS